MNNELITNTIVAKPPLVVELIGPAGAGKTTLARALSQRDEKILVAADIQLRKMEHILFFIGHAPFLLPVFVRRFRYGRGFTWEEIKAMVYLEAWPHVLKQEATHSARIILLDHGPIFKLATLNAFGPERLKCQGFEQWWDDMFKQWALTLDMVIWLDAADTNLVERINTRSQRHLVKGQSEQEATKFLARYRTSYEQVMEKLRSHGGPKLLQFDTSQTSIDQILDEIVVNGPMQISKA